MYTDDTYHILYFMCIYIYYIHTFHWLHGNMAPEISRRPWSAQCRWSKAARRRWKISCSTRPNPTTSLGRKHRGSPRVAYKGDIWIHLEGIQLRWDIWGCDRDIMDTFQQVYQYIWRLGVGIFPRMGILMGWWWYEHDDKPLDLGIPYFQTKPVVVFSLVGWSIVIIWRFPIEQLVL